MDVRGAYTSKGKEERGTGRQRRKGRGRNGRAWDSMGLNPSPPLFLADILPWVVQKRNQL